MQLKNLKIKLDNGEEVGDVYNAVCNELVEIEEETLRGNITRLREQLIEENEKCSKYFMNFEIRNYKSKCITPLLKDEQILNQQSTESVSGSRGFPESCDFGTTENSVLLFSS